MLRKMKNAAECAQRLALLVYEFRLTRGNSNSIGRVDVQGSRRSLYRKDGITVKRLIELALLCGFLFVLVGCSDTKSTKTGGASGVTKTTESKKTEE
jgi:hypothetical protein